MVCSMNRLSIFVDGNNMFYAQQKNGWFFDPRRVTAGFLAKASSAQGHARRVVARGDDRVRLKLRRSSLARACRLVAAIRMDPG